MILLKNVKIKKDDEETLVNKIKKILWIEDDFKYEIYKKSIDARNGITFNYQVLVDVHLTDRKLQKIKDAEVYKEENFKISPPYGDSKVVIVGTGPAGIFCGYILAKYGIRPILIERGKKVEERVEDVEKFLDSFSLDEESNVQFGEGGAGTFSDGKLTARSKDKRLREVLKIYVENGAPEDILYESKPHIGTDVLRDVVANMRKYIEKKGGEFRFSTKMNDIEFKGDRVTSIDTTNGKIEADNFVLALGNSARDTFFKLSENVKMENKPFAVGFRIEHKQRDIDLAQYKVKDETFPPASYNLTYRDEESGIGVYTFCMCPGGYVINASSEKDHLCVNGMSFHSRDGENSNSAIIATIDEKIYGSKLLDGIRFQREIEKKAYELGGESYLAPVQKVGDFLENKETTEFGKIIPTVKPGYKPSNLRGIYPEVVESSIANAIKYMDKRLRGFAAEDAILTGVETRSSCPIRILRDENMKSLSFENLYPIGEGSGYSGGIVSSAIDGIKVAELILKGE